MIWGKSHSDVMAEYRVAQEPKAWFAWRPVELGDGRKVWLQTVKRHAHAMDNKKHCWKWHYEEAK